MMTNGRADPMADFDLSDFATKPAVRPKVDVDAVREASEKLNFPSRAAKKSASEETAVSAQLKPRSAPHSPSPVSQKARGTDTLSPLARDTQRRRRTGRNQQLNLKVTSEVAERFAKLADAHHWVFGEAFEKAVTALEEKYPAFE